MRNVIASLLVSAALVAVSSQSSYADSTTTSGSQSGSWSSSGISIGSATQAPSAIAPGLITSGISCSGSVALGGSGAGWGLSLGITKEDKHCNAREDAKYIHGITKNTAAAMARLCMVRENREAFRLAGTPCPQDFQRVRSPRSPERTTRTTSVNYEVKETFSNMQECRRYARSNPGVSCVGR